VSFHGGVVSSGPSAVTRFPEALLKTRSRSTQSIDTGSVSAHPEMAHFWMLLSAVSFQQLANKLIFQMFY